MSGVGLFPSRDLLLPGEAQTAERILALPEGYVRGAYGERSYGIITETFAAGRSRKVLARELGGPDLISCNLYLTSRGPLLKPCEMPIEKVQDFLLNVDVREPDPSSPA